MACSTVLPTHTVHLQALAARIRHGHIENQKPRPRRQLSEEVQWNELPKSWESKTGNVRHRMGVRWRWKYSTLLFARPRPDPWQQRAPSWGTWRGRGGGVGGGRPTRLSSSQWAVAVAAAGGERGPTGQREARTPLASTQRTRRCWFERPLSAGWCRHPWPLVPAPGAPPWPSPGRPEWGTWGGVARLCLQVRAEVTNWVGARARSRGRDSEAGPGDPRDKGCALPSPSLISA